MESLQFCNDTFCLGHIQIHTFLSNHSCLAIDKSRNYNSIIAYQIIEISLISNALNEYLSESEKRHFNIS